MPSINSEKTNSESIRPQDTNGHGSNHQKQLKLAEKNLSRTVIRLPHHINTSASGYYPCPMPDGKILFTGMDRTGHFDYKIDYTVTRTAGGEDGFISGSSNGLSEDARPLPGNLNTNAHEAVTQVMENGDYLMTANYQENLNHLSNENGAATPDLFIFRNKTNRITHLPEPVNSIYGEYDGFMLDGEKAILFVSDRPGGQGDYKKKGFLWNENLWGNTDVYVCVKEGGEWSNPINLGPSVNTPFAERTPWLSQDGKTLYISSNAYTNGNNDLDIYEFTRTDTKVWNNWSGPTKITDVCSEGDDWCYRPDEKNGNTYFARSLKLPYKTTSPSREGDGYVRETGWRPGYTVGGAQAAALRKDFQTDLFMALMPENPAITLPEVLFDVNSAKINNKAVEPLERLLDWLMVNSEYKIEIQGHTDNTGSENLNMTLSLERAKAVKNFLLSNGVPSESIAVSGKGAQKPAFPNNNASNKQKNRRVEIFFKKIL